MVYLATSLLLWRLASPANGDDKATNSKVIMDVEWATELSNWSRRSRASIWPLNWRQATTISAAIRQQPPWFGRLLPHWPNDKKAKLLLCHKQQGFVQTADQHGWRRGQCSSNWHWTHHQWSASRGFTQLSNGHFWQNVKNAHMYTRTQHRPELQNRDWSNKKEIGYK